MSKGQVLEPKAVASLIAQIVGLLPTVAGVVGAAEASSRAIDRIWLTHRSHDPGKIVVNWETEQAGDSVVHYGLSEACEWVVRKHESVRLHHVEIPLPRKGVRYHYWVSTGNRRSALASFKGCPRARLRVAVVANWQRKPKLDAIEADDPHLLLTAGDNIPNLWQVSRPGARDSLEAYRRLVAAYPGLFRAIPVMPVLGNHDHQMRPRGPRPPAEPVYDIEASAFRRFFELPDDEWKWFFDVPDFGVRFIALDIHHISDFATTWQSCHPFEKGSAQLEWYRDLMETTTSPFVVTLYNERNAAIRNRAGGMWHNLFSRGSIAISGFGYYAERAEVNRFPYYNVSLSGRGDRYPDPHSTFIASKDNYILLTFTRQPPRMAVELKTLSGSVLHREEIRPRAGR